MTDATQPPRDDSDTNQIVRAPMPLSRRMTCEVFRDDLRGLKREAREMKRRGSSLPFQFTVGWSCVTAALASGVGLYVIDHSELPVDKNVRTMYLVGAVAFGVLGLALLFWWYRTRKSHWQDVDALIEEIERIEYDAPVE